MGKHGYAPKTREVYGYALGHWAVFLSEQEDVLIREPDTWNASLPAMFYEKRVEAGRGWSTTQLYLWVVMQYLKFIGSALPFGVGEAKNKLDSTRKTVGLE
jgi:hypothetical protein